MELTIKGSGILGELLLGSISLLFLVACTEANPTPTPTAASSPINQERAIGIASTDSLMPPEVVARAHITAQLVGDAWEVTFDQVNAHRDELRWPSMGLGSPQVYKTLVLRVDANTGEVVGRTALPLALSDADAPLPPLKLVAVQVRLEWLDYATNETSYVVERSKSSEPGRWTEVPHPADTTVSVDKEVVQGITYSYRVKARNNIGDSPYSNIAIVTILAEGTSPAITGKVDLRGEQQHGGVTVQAGGPGYGIVGHTSTTESRPDGSFALSGMPPGYYQLRFVKDGFAQTRRDAVVKEGESLVLPDVWLFKNGSIRGRVLFADGQPAKKVVVVRWTLDRAGIKVATDEEGFYQIPNQEPGGYLLTAVATGYSPMNRCVPVLVTPGTETLVENITFVPSPREEFPSCP